MTDENKDFLAFVALKRTQGLPLTPVERRKLAKLRVESVKVTRRKRGAICPT